MMWPALKVVRIYQHAKFKAISFVRSPDKKETLNFTRFIK